MPIEPQTQAPGFYEIEVRSIDGRVIKMAEFKGKTLLIVNTASQCGYTPQYEGLNHLYEKYKDRGFVVMGFPCNQFGAQEPGDESEIAQFCDLNYKVTFPMFAKIEVNGRNEHPLYTILKRQVPGVLGTKAIKWNFTKFLVSPDGRVLKRFAPQDKPENLQQYIEALLD